jgi:predicted RNA-binding protein with PIN domain
MGIASATMSSMERYLVDGMNVVGSRPDGWWRDRPGAARSLAADLRDWAMRTGSDVTVVFDGRPGPAGEVGAPLTVVFARHADDEIAQRAAADPDPTSLVVVTSDGKLTRRVTAVGARVSGSGGFRRQVETR